jgi:hypothetical protein
LEITDSLARATLSGSHPSGSDWIPIGDFHIKLSDLEARPENSTEGAATLTIEQERERDSARLGDLVAAAMVSRVVRVDLSRGPKVKGKESFSITIVNESPMILNGLALGGVKGAEDSPPSVLVGISLPPLKNLTVPASAEMVARLHLQEGARVLAADLSGL